MLAALLCKTDGLNNRRRLYSQNRKKCGILNHMETLIKGIPELFGKSIGIEEPWYIRSIETKNDEVHVYARLKYYLKMCYWAE